MELIQLQTSDKENSVKYLLKLDGKDIGYGYIFDRENNPIEIFIAEEHQSNGYGKIFFNSLLKIVKNKGLKGVLFKVDRSNYRFINIIQKAGAFEIGREALEIKYAIKLQ